MKPTELHAATRSLRSPTLRGVAREGLWSMRYRPLPRGMLTWSPGASELREVTIEWPSTYLWPPQRTWVEPIRLGLAELVPVSSGNIVETARDVVPFRVRRGRATLNAAVDYGDETALQATLLDRYDVVFKMQHLRAGYGSEKVVPGGFVPNSQRIYRYLPPLRRVRESKMPTTDVYGRFGGDKALGIRTRAVSLLDTQQRVSFHGGIGAIRYAESLAEAARARTCLDLPGKGPFCFRLVDYLAIGSCVIGPPHSTRLHVDLEDGLNVVWCRPDLEDLVDLAERTAHDERYWKQVSTAARTFFDRYLDYRQLAGYYLTVCLERL